MHSQVRTSTQPLLSFHPYFLVNYVAGSVTSNKSHCQDTSSDIKLLKHCVNIFFLYYFRGSFYFTSVLGVMQGLSVGRCLSHPSVHPSQSSASLHSQTTTLNGSRKWKGGKGTLEWRRLRRWELKGDWLRMRVRAEDDVNWANFR